MINKNIAIVVKHLGEGGVQKSSAVLSLMLDNLGYKVYIITLYDKINFKHKGDHYVLKEKGNSKIVRKIVQFIDFRRFVKTNNFDLIIDFRGRTNFFREHLINNYIYKNPQKVIFTVRESELKNYFPSPFFVFKPFYKNAFKIICVSKAIENSIGKKFSLQNLVTINNGFDFDQIDQLKNEKVTEHKNFVVSVGRFTKVKQFEQLIEAYSWSILKSKGISLILLGDGELKPKLIELIRDKKLGNNVFLLPFTSNPYKYMLNAKFLILPSQREGFPNVLVEALVCNTPVIAFDCNAGPGEIIKHEQNGLLVDDQNFKALVIAINRMVEDEVLYTHCKKNSRISIETFHMNKVAILWHDLIQSKN